MCDKSCLEGYLGSCGIGRVFSDKGLSRARASLKGSLASHELSVVLRNRWDSVKQLKSREIRGVLRVRLGSVG